MGWDLGRPARASGVIGLVAAGAFGASAAAAPSTELGEVLVTAGGRQQAIVDTPIAVTAFSAEALETARVTDLDLLQQLSASLTLSKGLSASYGVFTRIRGVGTAGSNVGLESAVGVTVDGVPLSRSNIALDDLVGVSRIEVVNGPQGTLFGRNTTAGVITVETARPGAAFQAEASLDAGSNGAQRYVASAGGPAAPGLGLRLDLLHARRDGVTRNLAGGPDQGETERTVGRAQAVWTPTQRLEMRLTLEASRREETPTGQIYRTAGPSRQVIGLLAAAPVPIFDGDPNANNADTRSLRFDRGDAQAVTLQTRWDAGWGVVDAISGYRRASFRRSYDVDQSNADLLRDPRDGERYSTFTQELRLRRVSGRLDAVLGAFASDETIRSHDSYTFGAAFEPFINIATEGFLPLFTGLGPGAGYPSGAGADDRFEQRGRSFALFTHNILAVTNRLSLTAGLRQTWESKSLTAQLAGGAPACAAAVARFGPALAGVPAQLQPLLCIPNFDSRLQGSLGGKRREQHASGVLALRYEASEDVNLYASYSRGYKSGGYQFDRAGLTARPASGAQLAFAPEFTDSVEAGVKASLAGGAVDLSATAFAARFSDYQFNYFSGLQRVTVNLPRLDTRGVELQGAVRPGGGFDASAALTYTDAAFAGSAFPAGLAPLRGATPSGAPRWVATLALNQRRPLGDGSLEIFGHIDARWQSRSDVGTSGLVGREWEQAGYATVGARLGLARSDGRWSVEAWGRNLGDSHAWTQLFAPPLQDGSVVGSVVDPRAYGMTLRARL